MEFRILGSLEIHSSDGSPLQVSGSKQRSLLGLLLIHANEVLSTDRIIDALWGDEAAPGALNTLRFHISKLRSALGGGQDRLATRGPGYVLLVAPGQIDAQRFEAAITEAGSIVADNPEAAVTRYRKALELWRGPALTDFEYEEFARPEIARLEELRLTAVEGKFEAELAAGRHDELVGELRALVAEYPLRERLWAALMTALYRSGRQAEALRAYQEARRILGDELGIEPSAELRDLEEKVLLQDDSIKAPAVPRRTHNLPARVSRFVGREQEISTVTKLLGRSRLLTLTGVGGVGKTSLALEVANRRLDDYDDGVWLIDFSAVGDPDAVILAVAEALRVHTRSDDRVLADLLLRLANRDSLLVFDNCEHVIAAAADLAAQLLADCPNVRIVATSRELLSIPGEVTFGVPPMSLTDDATDGDAVALFMERVEDHSPDSELTPEELATAQRICEALDGLPLAIELAAARTRTLSFHELERRLADRFDLLAGGSRTAPARQRTLRATLDWSYGLLTKAERRLFGALSVIPGGFSADTVEAATEADGEDAVDLLGSLVDKSLVARTHSRYYLLPTLRRYAAEKVDGKALASIRKALVTHYVAVASDLELELFTDDEGNAEMRLAEERTNLRASLAWAIDLGDTEAALQLAAALALHWTRSGVWTEGWLRRAGGAAHDVPQTVQLREGLLLLEGIATPADALASFAQVTAARGEHRRATRLLGAADRLRKDLGTTNPQSASDLAASLEDAVGTEVFDKGWREGRVAVGGS